MCARFEETTTFLGLVTMDETWVHFCLSSMEWRHSSSVKPKKVHVQKSVENYCFNFSDCQEPYLRLFRRY